MLDFPILKRLRRYDEIIVEDFFIQIEEARLL